ncbi:MAG TPA: chromosome segregation protein SMC [Anaerolineae bacterium]
MHLKHLVLNGYKTFANKTAFDFTEGITAVIGPNGSGKSNVADSIRWALGEQQFSLLRGKKTDDMIFAGSSRRPRASMAEVLLTFDNSDGFFPVEFTEIAIGRRAYRDGANEYLLNGNRVRLRDITDLLGHTGLAERTYTVIGQGLVDTALTQRPEERRALFEEAAGIGAYRDRRDDALRKLEETRHNLERVRDILAEITPRVSQLERQASRARHYQVLSTELREHTRRWFSYHYHTARAADVKVTEARLQYEQMVSEARASVERLEADAAQLQQQQADLRSRVAEIQPRRDEARRSNEAVTRDLAVLRERAASVQSQLAAARRDQRERTAALEGASTRAAHASALLIGANATVAARQAELQIAESAAAERQAVRLQTEKNRTAAQQELLRANGVLTGAQNRLNAQRARQSVLSKQTRDLAEREARADEQRNRERLTLNELNVLIEADTARARELAAQHEAHQHELEGVRAALSAAQSDLAAAEAEEKMATRVNLFAEMRQQQSSSDLADQAQAAHLPGLRGTLASLTQVIPDDRRAVEAALGELLKAIVIESPEGVTRTRGWLIQQKARNTRLTIVPLPAMRLIIDERTRLDAVLAERARAMHARPLTDSLNTPAWLKPALQVLAGRMFLTRDLDTAKVLAQQLPEDALCVTRDGEVVYASGLLALPPGPRSPLIIGDEPKAETLPLVDPVAAKANHDRAAAARDKAQQEMEAARRRYDEQSRARDAFSRDASARLSRRDDAARRITSLEEQQAQMAGDIENAERELALVTEQINHTSASLAQYEQAHTLASHRMTEIENELRELMASGWLETLNHARAALTIATEAVRTAQNQRRERLAQLGDGITQRDARARRAAELEAQNEVSRSQLQVSERTAAEAAARLTELEAALAPIQVELRDVEQLFSQAEARRREAERNLREAESHLNTTLLEQARNDDELKALYERAADTLETDGQEQRRLAEEATPPVTGEVAPDAPTQIPEPAERAAERQAAVVALLDSLPFAEAPGPQIDERMTQLRNQIKRLGAINFEAQVEYDELKQRHDFLTTQTADLERASASLQQVIVELNDVMQATFKQTFEAIATAFQSTFKILFGGGQAKLTLTNADNIDEAGIDIHAQPPGKRPQGLALLSGGERSLTAGALLFAILRVKPTPFCVLDEMDAALDEANVARFRSMLETLSEQTQFIVITHNRRTVEAANTIYGISMSVDGVSTALSLRLDEVQIKPL